MRFTRVDAVSEAPIHELSAPQRYSTRCWTLTLNHRTRRCSRQAGFARPRLNARAFGARELSARVCATREQMTRNTKLGAGRSFAV
jgi:hypothetical protein